MSGLDGGGPIGSLGSAPLELPYASSVILPVFDFKPVEIDEVFKDKGSHKPLRMDKKKAADSPQSDDLILEHRRVLEDHGTGKVLTSWITSALNFGEISHDDLRKLSYSELDESSVSSSPMSSDFTSASTRSIAIPAGAPGAAAAVSSPSVGGKVPKAAYATLYLYEVSAFDLPPPEVEPAPTGLLRFFCCVSNTASTSEVPSGSQTRSTFAEIALSNRKPMSLASPSPMIEDEKVGDEEARMRPAPIKQIESASSSPIRKEDTSKKPWMKLGIQKTSVNACTLSPTWKVSGALGPAAARKRPQMYLMQFSFGFAEIFSSSFHIEIRDEKNNELLGFADFDLQKLFENTFGTATSPYYKPLSPPGDLDDDDDDFEREEAKSPATPGSEDSDQIPPMRSVGRLRIRVAVSSEQYLVDLLRGPEEELIITGLNIILRMVQYCELQQLFNSEPASAPHEIADRTGRSDRRSSMAAEKDKVGAITPKTSSSAAAALLAASTEEVHPLRAFLHPEKFMYIFSTIPIIEQDPKYASDPSALQLARRRVASLIASIFTAGIARYGPLFASAFENFGDELAMFTDMERFGEDLVLSFLHIIQQVPKLARLEVLYSKKSKLIETLFSLLAIDRMEDSHVKSLLLMNFYADQLSERKHWLESFLDRLIVGEVDEFVIEQLTSWHPQLQEESLKLFCHFYNAGKMSLTPKVLDALRAMEAESIGGKQASTIQKIIFGIDFRLKCLPLLLDGTSCKSRLIYPLKNLLTQESSEVHTPRGVYQDLAIVIKIAGPSDTLVTHLVGVSPFFSSPHAATAMALFLSTKPITISELGSLAKHSRADLFPDPEEKVEKKRSNIDSTIKPICLLEFKDDSYSEFTLKEPMTARYLGVIVNPFGLFRSKSHIEMNYVAAIGYSASEDSDKTPRRPHTELSGRIGTFLGMKWPKAQASSLEAVLTSPEAMKNMMS